MSAFHAVLWKCTGAPDPPVPTAHCMLTNGQKGTGPPSVPQSAATSSRVRAPHTCAELSATLAPSGSGPSGSSSWYTIGCSSGCARAARSASARCAWSKNGDEPAGLWLSASTASMKSGSGGTSDG